MASPLALVLKEAARLHPSPYTSETAANSAWAQFGGSLLRRWGNSAILDYPPTVLTQAAMNLHLPADTATKDINFVGGVPVYWYQSPEQLFYTFTRYLFLVMLGAFIVLRFFAPFKASFHAARNFQKKDAAALSPKASAKFGSPSMATGGWFQSFRSGLQRFLAPLDYVTRALCVVTLVATFAYKVPTGRWPFMLQPCHWLCSILVYLCFVKDEEPAFPPSSSKGKGGKGGAAGARHCSINAQLFNFFLNCIYGPIAALLVPDMRGLDLPGEQFNFWLEHVVLVLLPVIWIARRRFDIIGGAPFTFMSWCVFWVIHGVFLIPVSVVTGSNIDYVLAPPKQWPSNANNDPKSWFHPSTFYPLAMAFFFVVAFVVRFGLINATVWLTGTAWECRLEAKEADAKAAAKAEAIGDKSSHEPHSSLEAMSGKGSHGVKSRSSLTELPSFLAKAELVLPPVSIASRRSRGSSSSSGRKSPSSENPTAPSPTAAAAAASASAVLRFALYESPQPPSSRGRSSNKSGASAGRVATLAADGGKSPRQPNISPKAAAAGGGNELRKRAVGNSSRK